MKRIASLFLFVMLASILAACGGTTDTGTTSTAASTAAASTEAASTAAASTDTSAASAMASMEASMEASPMASMEASAAASTAAASTAAASTAAGGTAAAVTCAAAGPKVDRLVWWTRSAEGDASYAAMQTVAKNYEAAGGSPVELVTVIDAEFRNKMSISAPGGEGPDVFGPIAHDWLGEFALQKIALEIPKAKITAADDIIPTAFDAATSDGKLYGIPIWVESVGLIYNKDLVPTPPTTWDDFVKIAKEQTKGDVQGFGFPLLEQYHEGPFFNGFGSYIFKYQDGKFDTNDIGLNNDAGVAAAKFLRDMYYTEKLVPDVAIDRANMHAVQEGLMEEGKLAMTINGPWREAPLTKAGINYGVAQLPTLPDGKPMIPFLGVQVYGVNAYSKNQDAAIDFANFITCTDSVVEQFKGENKVPVRQSALANATVKANANIPTWNAQAAAGTPMPNIPAMGPVWKPWGDAMDAIIGQNAPDDQIKPLLDTAVEQIKAAIAQTQ
jgi:maltose-binding protein MalE